jgi:YggT family protein
MVDTTNVGFESVLGVLRIALFGLAAAAAVVAAVDWGVRTRRINPFNPVARFFRQSVEPLMLPIERRVVRAGGLPSSAPWWSLVAVVVGGIIVLSLLSFLRDQFVLAAASMQAGPRGLYVLVVSWIFGILQIALIVRVISSWFRAAAFSRWVRWAFVLTEPILRPLRQIVPSIGMIDITPIIAYFLLRLLGGFLVGLA